ncbi:Uncharacterised protein [Vibrio cholerae]|nr:Uncharacterised protein [Vibrio cholerae]CSA97308.1 Uncharacterised protein [Vibrio cholerae]CSI13803.1 Uncharacterised protein [Vibrio cholerae]
MACHFWTTDDEIQRHKQIFGTGWTVLERHVEWEVAIADLHAFKMRWNQGTGNAELFFITEQSFRVAQFKGKPQHSRHRCESDVALVPRQAHT